MGKRLEFDCRGHTKQVASHSVQRLNMFCSFGGLIRRTENLYSEISGELCNHSYLFLFFINGRESADFRRCVDRNESTVSQKVC